MAEKPILFSGLMVCAILEGRKTQTRRVVRLEPGGNGYGMLCRAGRYIEVGAYGPTWIPVGSGPRELCPRDVWMQYAAYQPGDTLWVRETWCPVNDEDTGGARWVDYRATPRYSAEHPAGWHEALDDAEALKWKASMFMPRWASRITLEVTDVRCQRLQEISEEDARAEGVEPCARGIYHPCRVRDADRPAACAFADLWESINRPRGFGWDSNPWVWAYTFKVLEVRR